MILLTLRDEIRLLLEQEAAFFREEDNPRHDAEVYEALLLRARHGARRKGMKAERAKLRQLFEAARALAH